MKRRDFGLIGIGLLIGLLAGVVVMSNDGLRDGLLGTAGLTPGAPPAYYLVDMGESRNWLTGTYAEQANDLSAAFDRITPLITTTNFGETVRAVEQDINLIVVNAYTALTGLAPANAAVPTPEPLPDPLLGSLSDGDVSTCLGLDENPYNVDGYALYLYIEIPSTQTQFVPETWERLSEPKDDDLFWQRLACQSLEQAQQPGRR
ncbi:MAG TPA: hypothetical protein VK003_03770 [Oceanobacillus sp.]|nr:hypothetical protein [Oceanobacillus sp.]